MIAIIRAFLYILIIAAIVFFAISNKEVVSVTYSPFHSPVSMSLAIVTLSSLATGFFFGCFMVWLNTVSVHFDRFKQKKRVKKLEKTVKTMEDSAKDTAKIDIESPLATAVDFHHSHHHPTQIEKLS